MSFDDEGDSKNCAFVRRFIDYMSERALEYREKAALAPDQGELDRWTRKADKAAAASHKTARGLSEGGCLGKGLFYIRDSIYSDTTSAPYDYDLTRTGDEAPYAKTIVLHEYEWVRYMANHATQIYIE